MGLRPLDPDYFAFGVLMVVFGIVGMTATAGISPNIFASATCNCIPSPAARLQELSLVAFDIGVVLFPIGFFRRPALAAGGPVERGQAATNSGRVYAGVPVRSGGLLSLGVTLVTFGVAVTVSSIMVLGNTLLVVEGLAMVAAGLYTSYRGGRAP
jgi:hypothetical protein